MDYNTPQTSVLFSHPVLFSNNSKEIFSVVIANMVLGVGDQSRLFKKTRGKDGIVYDINTNLCEKDINSFIVGGASTNSENRDNLIKTIKNIFKELSEKGINQEELDFYKTAIAVSEDLSSAPNIVSFLSVCRGREIKLSEVNSYMNNFYDLKLEDVNKVIKKIFNPDKLTFVTVGVNPNKGGKHD